LACPRVFKNLIESFAVATAVGLNKRHQHQVTESVELARVADVVVLEGAAGMQVVAPPRDGDSCNVTSDDVTCTSGWTRTARNAIGKRFEYGRSGNTDSTRDSANLQFSCKVGERDKKSLSKAVAS
jgi:hypothetical protein